MARPGTFQPGQSGNPSGRPAALGELKALARKHTPEAIAALADALKNPKERVAAATALLDRAWGKPAQAIAGPDGESPVAAYVIFGEREAKDASAWTAQHAPDQK